MRLKEWMSFFLSLLMIFAVLGFWNVQRVSAADVTDKAKIEDLKILSHLQEVRLKEFMVQTILR